MKRVLGSVLLLMAVFAAQAQTEVPVETPDVAIVFPQQPRDTVTQSKVSRIHLYQTKTSTGNFNLLVGTPLVFEVPSQQHPQLGEFYDAIVQGEVRGARGKLLSQRDLTVQGFRGREYIFQHPYQGGLTYSRNWIFAMAPTIYTVRFFTVPGASRLFRQGSEQPFFDSFRIKKEVTKEGKVVVAAPKPAAKPAETKFPLGRLLIAAPVLMALLWWVVMRLSRSRKKDDEEEENG
jgi:hypothetical protein